MFSSSAFAMGWTHDPSQYQPRYFPLDEVHPPLVRVACPPTRHPHTHLPECTHVHSSISSRVRASLAVSQPHETYGLSKLVGEDTAAAIARACRGRTTFASLRFTNVVHPDKEHLLPWAPPSADAPSSALMWAWTKVLRRGGGGKSACLPAHCSLGLDSTLCAQAGEVADAHVLALEAESVGPEHHEAFLIAAPTTRFRERTEELLSRRGGGGGPLPSRPLARIVVLSRTVLSVGPVVLASSPVDCRQRPRCCYPGCTQGCR